jgi:hypothetical protein
LELRNPKSVHSLDYLYARWDTDGNRKMNAEDSLQNEVDNHTPRFIQSVIDRYPNTVPLSDKERRFFARLIIRTIVRNPAVLNSLINQPLTSVAKWAISLSRWLQRSGKEDKATNRLGKIRVIEGDMIETITTIDIDKRVEEFAKKRFIFMTPDADARNFVLGSQPYYIKPSAKSKNAGDEMNLQKDSFVGMVLHPRLLLALMDDAGTDEHLIISHADVNRLNGMFFKYSSKIAMVSANDIHGSWYWEHGQEESDQITQVFVEQNSNDSKDFSLALVTSLRQ